MRELENNSNVGKEFLMTTPKCNDPYINYTIENYARCYDSLDDSSIEKFSSFFSQLKTNRIVEKSKYVDSGINSGYSMIPVGQRPRINEEFSRELMTSLGDIVDEKKPDGDTEVAFLKSMLSLIDAISYIDVDEMYPLNNMFSNIELFKHDLYGPYDDFYYTKKRGYK